VQTSECRTNIGITPARACPVNNKPQPTPTPATATTSPYEYVTTAVYPQCGVQGNSCANWDQDCTNPSCYGLPLYRQFLTGTGTSSANATREVAAWFAANCNNDQTTRNAAGPSCGWAGRPPSSAAR
jgi:hypothetical protein